MHALQDDVLFTSGLVVSFIIPIHNLEQNFTPFPAFSDTVRLPPSLCLPSLLNLRKKISDVCWPALLG